MTVSCCCRPKSISTKGAILKSASKLLGFFFGSILLLSEQVFGQNLDFGSQDPTQVVSRESMLPFANLTFILFAIYVLAGLALIAYFLFRKKPAWYPPVTLNAFPSSAKVAITLNVLCYSLVHALALWEVYLQTKINFKSTSEYFFYMKLPKLVATSHAHLFGHGTMYFITSVIFIFSKMSESRKIIFISLALSAGLLDVPSWWAIKFGGSDFEVFSAIAGIMSVAGWGFMTLRITYELWWDKIMRRTI